MKNDDQHIDFDLLARYFDQELTEPERQQVEGWVAKSDENAAEFSKIKKAHLFSTQTAAFDANTAWQKLNTQISNESQETPIRQLIDVKAKRPYFKWALAASILLVAALFISQPWISNQNQYASLTEKAEPIALPDGSTLYLNKNSTVNFEENALKSERSVQLFGEAFFSVTRNEKKPFVINTEHTKITVLGTSFNVNATGTTLNDEVVVSSGRVAVQSLKSGNRVELQKGQKAVVNHETGTVVLVNKAPTQDLFWKTKTLDFKDTELDTVIKIIEDLFNIQIDLVESDMGRQTYTGQFVDEPVKSIIEKLAVSNCLELTQTSEKSFVLDGKGCFK